MKPIFVALTFALFAGCARGEITLPDDPVTNQVTVDASAGFAYIDLSSGGLVAQTSASTSTSWDIGFNATTVVLNGGTAGPAGVTGYCICQNSAATNDQILAFTPDSQLAAFNAVTVQQIPALSSAFSADVFTNAKWYRYNLANDNRISPTFDVFLVKHGTSVYKVQLINYYGPEGEARRISFRYVKLV